jgi:predicted amidohydrolase
MSSTKTAQMSNTPAYTALALQTRCDAINRYTTRGDVRQHMQRTVQRLRAQIAASKAFIGSDLRLVVLPEYFLTGFPMGESIALWRELACLAMDDAIYQELGEICTKHNVYLAGNAYETDPNFPNLYFQTSFLLDDLGTMVLRYRRLVSMYAPTPHDVWSKYLEIYGMDAVFPVADTALGRFAAIASEEVLYPEIARAHALRGAEIYLHCTSEVGSAQLTPKAIAKRARAYENMAYLVSANSAGIAGTSIPEQSTDGMSCVVDYKGNLLVEAGFGESMVAFSTIDISALRAWRRRPGMANILSRQRTELFAPIYAQHSVYPANTLIDSQATREHFMVTQQSVITKLIKGKMI